jgi:26S proteasome non-ATPase regulatory subunit 9
MVIESPAAAAGLLAGDQVLVFGTADARNHRELAAVKEIVARNVGSAIRVLVRRRPLMTAGGESAGEWEWLGLLLTPMQWRGLGMLGCLLMPLPTAQP